jgi:hypothetical protein
MFLRLVLFLVAGLFTVSVTRAADPPPELVPRLKVRIEVSKKIAGLIAVKHGKVLLKNGSEITLLRGCDVEIVAADRRLDFNWKPAVKPPVDLMLQIQLNHEFPARLANPPRVITPQGVKKGSMDRACSNFLFVCYAPVARNVKEGMVGGGVEGMSSCKNRPRGADWEKSRLAGLAKLDGLIRQRLGERLQRPAQVPYHEKEGWYLHNPYPFVVAGKAQLLAPEKQRKQVTFRLAPGSKGQWVDTGRFTVHDLVLGPPDKPSTKK